MDTDIEIGNFLHNITWLRKQHGLSRKRMGSLLGIGTGTLRKIEEGEYPPRLGVGVLLAVYRHFGILPSELVGTRLGEQ